MPFIDYSFLDAGKIISLECNLSDGWRMHTETYCFSEGLLLDWKFDKRIGITVSIFPRPGGSRDAVKQWPPIKVGTCTLKWSLVYSVDNGFLGIRIPLLVSGGESKTTLANGDVPNCLLPWHEKGGDLRLHFIDRQIATYGNTKYELQVLCVFRSPVGPPPTMIDWCRRFYPGGLPTLGKKR